MEIAFARETRRSETTSERREARSWKNPVYLREICNVRHVRGLGPGIIYATVRCFFHGPAGRYDGMTARMLHHLACLGYLGHEFLVHTYPCTRSAILPPLSSLSLALSPLPSLHPTNISRGCDESLLDGPLFFPANPPCYLRSPEKCRGTLRLPGNLSLASQKS